ncbi:MAG: FKBP-type peptidyl-prolyl cis-trans isomerase [Alistipes sp.]|jgi:FKBP-type peptidyl-prolyl cis-trans isomerase|nr:FKBP-type peptidyl-prolyl cis-trans isomerase [Alistipes sp.]
MKKAIIPAVAFCAALVSCQGSKSMKSYTVVDSVSYAVGVDLVNQFQLKAFQDSMLIGDVLATAVRDVFDGKAQMTPEVASAFLNEYFNVRKPALDKAESMKWLEEVKTSNPNIQTTESGLMYEIINAGDPAVKAVNDADQVVVKYRGTYQDGTEFDANENATLPLNGVIAAWTEGMKLVGKGGEIILWANPDLAYALQGNMRAMKFEITLHDVIPATPAE